MAREKGQGKQNLTVSLDKKTIQSAKVIAARRATSISGLVAEQIAALVGEEEAYDRAERQALILLDKGFHLGGAIRATRDELPMSGKTFVDTNVLLYAHDVDADVKHAIAKTVLQELWSERTGVVSAQVLQELYVNVTRKIATPLPKELARRVVDSYATWCTETTPEEISAAFRIEDDPRIGFWDALIVSCAAKSGAVRILSEDLVAGPRIAGILIENPFANVR